MTVLCQNQIIIMGFSLSDSNVIIICALSLKQIFKNMQLKVQEKLYISVLKDTKIVEFSMYLNILMPKLK